MKLPMLYKKTSTGAIQFWEIETGEYDGIAWFETTYGQLGTDSPQTTTDYIENGKNIGKKNETTPLQQAEAEAQAKWEKQLKKGYVESIEAAKAGEVDDLVEGGVVPMLAHTFEKQGKKIKYPCYTQPKLDGIRCIATLKNGVCTLWSRTRKSITSCPHIVAEIEKNFKEDVILDGELYNHSFRSTGHTIVQIPEGEVEIMNSQLGFEHIVHLVRQEKPDPQHTDVQYHIYDTINDQTFDERTLFLSKKFSSPKSPNFIYLKLVTTHIVEEENQVAGWFTEFVEQGYEGAMLRNSAGLYVNKRSSDLIKVKEMQDAEFEIVGIEEGRGKLAGHVGAFICRMANGGTFSAKMAGETERLQDYFENHSLWEGKKLTVQYQGLTSYGIPRFPVGIRIRID
jgi:DNA ligase-1